VSDWCAPATDHSAASYACVSRVESGERIPLYSPPSRRRTRNDGGWVVRPTKEERERSASYRWSPPGEIVAGAIMWWFTLTAAIGYLAWRFFHYDALIIPLVVGVIVWRVASHFGRTLEGDQGDAQARERGGGFLSVSDLWD